MTDKNKGKPKATAQGATSTNKTKKSLVKVVVVEDVGKWVSPSAKQEFYIDESATFPTINFEIDTQEPPPYAWKWSISWDAKVGTREGGSRGKKLKTFTESGTFDSNDKKWTADVNKKVVGGKLTVEVTAGASKFKRFVIIKGKNPSEQSVKDLLATISDVKGFEKIITQESHFKNFINSDGEPIVAFDGGYGLTQMTTPAPTYMQVWNWKENVKGGCSLYQQKQKAAKAHLGQSKRTYTDEQLKLETWSRWNGGSYHVWDDKTKQWVRNDNILCDTETGNIGWDMTKEDNKDKTEADLHKRDKGEYKKPPAKKDRKWTYTGICYADHLNQE
ncbi:hypothetical protein [Frateuria sp. Soil773]|uniref:hypothetical protein n=1 Tax=Frateuria sp. Soil773 TaxID=1736407 RepID=UPI0009E78B78|nr:hypothetical protein [Frateuria sp. Soil773]